MTLHTNSVIRDHVDAGRIFAVSRSRIEDALVCMVFAIHTGALVSLPSKLAGGDLPGLGFVWAFGAALCFVFAATNIKKTIAAALTAWPVVLITLLACISYSWSVSTYDTARTAIYLTCTTLFAFSLSARFTWLRIIELLAWTVVTLVAFSIVFAVAMPSVGRMTDIHVGAWSGVWPEKQSLGIYGCLGVIAALTLISLGRKSALWWVGVGLCVVAIIGSTGKTAILMCVVGIAMGLWLRISNRGVLGAVFAGWLGVIGGALGVLVISGGLDFVLSALGRSSDFTGRTEVWEAAHKLGNMRPMTGWGFQSVWRGEMLLTSPYQWIMDWTDFKPANAHSSWLDIYMQLGRPGFALLALIMVWAWLAVLFRGAKDARFTAFAGATLMAITFISFTETNLMAPMDLQWFLVVLLATKLHLDYRAQPKQDKGHPNGGMMDGDTFTFNG